MSKNSFVLILWLKKGGGLIREGVLYAGFYGKFQAVEITNPTKFSTLPKTTIPQVSGRSTEVRRSNPRCDGTVTSVSPTGAFEIN